VTEASEFTGRVAVIIPTYNERDNVESVGYCFQIDLARRARLRSVRVSGAAG